MGEKEGKTVDLDSVVLVFPLSSVIVSLFIKTDLWGKKGRNPTNFSLHFFQSRQSKWSLKNYGNHGIAGNMLTLNFLIFVFQEMILIL